MKTKFITTFSLALLPGIMYDRVKADAIAMEATEAMIIFIFLAPVKVLKFIL